MNMFTISILRRRANNARLGVFLLYQTNKKLKAYTIKSIMKYPNISNISFEHVCILTYLLKKSVDWRFEHL